MAVSSCSVSEKSQRQHLILPVMTSDNAGRTHSSLVPRKLVAGLSSAKSQSRAIVFFEMCWARTPHASCSLSFTTQSCTFLLSFLLDTIFLVTLVNGMFHVLNVIYIMKATVPTC